MDTICKYPRTPHIEGSRLQPGDEGLACVPFENLAGRRLVVEEKVDGANCAVSFSANGDLLLQSRGHFLTGGARERQFDLFKTWAHSHQRSLWEVLGSRYIMYGEWLFAKHTLFYDALPHYFLEFDILDTEGEIFLPTERRHALLWRSPVVSVPESWRGRASSLEELHTLVGNSPYRTPRWRESLRHVCRSLNLDADQILEETDSSDLMEGLYVKVEEAGQVLARCKYVRASFRTAGLSSDDSWMSRPIVPNQLRAGVDLWGAVP